MLQKQPHPFGTVWFKTLKKFAAVAFIAEGLAFAGSYLFWYRLNTNREFRHYFHLNYPKVLDGYYKIGEYFDSEDSIKQIRRLDLAAWEVLDKKTKETEK